MWIRSALAYPASFALMMVTGILMTVIDFVAILLMFSHINASAGSRSREMALLYATASMTLGSPTWSPARSSGSGSGSAPGRSTST